MAYKKNITRNGKTYGTYYYTSIRVNGLVKTIYFGKKKPNEIEERTAKKIWKKHYEKKEGKNQ